PEALRPVALTADGKVVYRGNPDGSITRWDRGSGGQRLLEGRHRDAVQALALSPDGMTLASAGRDGSVEFHDTASRRERRSLQGRPLPVRCLAFSPDGALLASGEAPPRNLFRGPRPAAIKLWEVTTGEERFTFTGHAGGIWALAFSPDGKTLVSGSEDKSVK